MYNSLIKYKDLALKVTYYTKKRQIATKIFFATSKFKEILEYFDKNLKDPQTFLKSSYFLNGKQIYPTDTLLYFSTVDPNLRLVEEDMFLEIEDLEHLDDASEPIYEKLLKPLINPFKLIILNIKETILQRVDLPKEKIEEFGFDTINENFACCNSTDSLYISCGKNFWIISHKDFQIERKEMPFFKEKHSMAYILSNNTIFIAGGSEESFYYDINSKEFITWGKMNGAQERPGLIQYGDYLFSFNSFDQKGIYFEKTKLTNPAKKWDKIIPQSGDQESGFFYNKLYGVSKCSGGNILFAGGVNNQLRTFVYNIKLNVLFINPSKDESILLHERTFYKIDHNFNIAIPNNIEKDHIIALLNKTSKTLHLIPFEQIGIQTRNNILQIDNPRDRLPGNIIIQCRYMTGIDYENFLKQKEADKYNINNNKKKGAFDLFNKREAGKKLGDNLNAVPYKNRGKTPALERISEGRPEEESDDDDHGKNRSNSAKKEKRPFELSLDDIGMFNFSKKKKEENINKQNNIEIIKDEPKEKDEGDKNNALSISNGLNQNNNIEKKENKNEQKDYQKIIEKEEIIKENKLIINENKEEEKKNIENNLIIEKEKENNDKNKYNIEKKTQINEKRTYNFEIKKENENLDSKEEILEKENKKQEEDKENENFGVVYSEKINSKKKVNKKEEGEKNEFKEPNLSLKANSTLNYNSINNISKKYKSQINLKTDKINNNNTNNETKEKELNNITNKIQKDAIRKGVNNINKLDRNNVNINNANNMNIKEKYRTINNNINNNAKGYIIRNNNNQSEGSPRSNNISNNYSYNINITNNQQIRNIIINNDNKSSNNSQNNYTIPNLKNNQQNYKDNNNKDNNIIHKSNTSFMTRQKIYQYSNNNNNYSNNPFVDNDKYHNILEKDLYYHSRDDSEPNANKILTNSHIITIREIKKSQKKNKIKSGLLSSNSRGIPKNSNINYPQTNIDINDKNPNSNNNSNFNSYKPLTYRQLKGNNKLAKLNHNRSDNYNHNNSSNHDSGNLNYSEKKNKKNQDISQKVNVFKTEENRKYQNFGEIYSKLNKYHNLYNKNLNNPDNLSNNFLGSNSTKMMKSAFNHQYHLSNDKNVKGNKNIRNINEETVKDGKRYVLAKNVQRIRREDDQI